MVLLNIKILIKTHYIKCCKLYLQLNKVDNCKGREYWIIS